MGILGILNGKYDIPIFEKLLTQRWMHYECMLPLDIDFVLSYSLFIEQRSKKKKEEF